MSFVNPEKGEPKVLRFGFFYAHTAAAKTVFMVAQAKTVEQFACTHKICCDV